MKHFAFARLAGLAVIVGLAGYGPATHAQTSSPAPIAREKGAVHWLGSWASAQQIPEPRNALPADALTGASLRQLIRVSAGGKAIRIQVSNAFGTAPLRFGGVHVARAVSPASSAIVAGTDHAVTFNGSPEVVVPAGASYWSDPVPLAVAPLTTLAVTFYLPQAPEVQTSHPGSRATSYLVRGDRLAAPDLAGAETIDHWFQLAGVAVARPHSGRAIVALGDSITDGHAANTNANQRWTDRLAQRLQANPATRDVSVLNLGTGGNRLLLDGLGPNALARFDRDVLAQPGVRYLIVLEGINDLGTLTREAPASPAEHQAHVAQIIGAFRQIVLRARSHGIKAIGATIMPDGASGYYHPGPLDEKDRQAINAWIRTPGHFDAVIDFDRITRDPNHPGRLRGDIDSGDGLHPGPSGYRAMADAIPLSLFAR